MLRYFLFYDNTTIYSFYFHIRIKKNFSRTLQICNKNLLPCILFLTSYDKYEIINDIENFAFFHHLRKYTYFLIFSMFLI